MQFQQKRKEEKISRRERTERRVVDEREIGRALVDDSLSVPDHRNRDLTWCRRDLQFRHPRSNIERLL